MSTPAATAPPADGGAFQSLDDSHITKAQWKIMFVSGMGFFTDAYDLFVIGIVVALLETQWHLYTSGCLAAQLGHADRLSGRGARLRPDRRHARPQADLRLEVLILAAGAIASAFAPNYHVAAGLPRASSASESAATTRSSATIMSEYSGEGSRGQMVGLVFAMQGAGTDLRSAVRLGLLSLRQVGTMPSGGSCSGFGAIPGTRRVLPAAADPRDAAVREGRRRADEVAAAIAEATGQPEAGPAPRGASDACGQGFTRGLRHPRPSHRQCSAG